ncbi:MAG TPA: hypothetical protein VGV61_01385 [Thermoanaerobaculia bacterium]|jgi:hypothetical protein|nr:hypothetical protein [Thermoanaerobaculia bacterium]
MNRTNPLAVLTVLCGGLGLVASGPARAASGPRDGRVPIDQVCVAFGCFPGDAPGWPVEITQPGAYVLTSNLDVTGQPSPENVTAVVVSVSGVDLDLGGFALHGPASCVDDWPVTCQPASGSGDGVRVTASATALHVHDGNITGFGGNGVVAAANLLNIERVRFAHMRLTAVTVVGGGLGARISNVVVGFCGGGGVKITGDLGAVLDSSIGAVSAAVATAGFAQVQTNALNSRGSGAIGITSGSASRLAGLSVQGSQAIFAGNGSLVLDSTLDSDSPILDCGPNVGYNGLNMHVGVQPEVNGSCLSFGQNQCANNRC